MKARVYQTQKTYCHYSHSHRAAGRRGSKLVVLFAARATDDTTALIAYS